MSDDAAVYQPFVRLLAGATVEERRMLHELRTICNDAGFDVDELATRQGELMVPAFWRAHEIRTRLAATGVWDRLDALVEEYHAAVAPGPDVQTMIVYSPTDNEEHHGTT